MIAQTPSGVCARFPSAAPNAVGHSAANSGESVGKIGHSAAKIGARVGKIEHSAEKSGGCSCGKKVIGKNGF